MDTEKIIRSLKLQLLIERAVFGAIILCVLTTWTVQHFSSGKSLIIVDGKPMACVASKREAQDVLRQVKSQTGYNVAEVSFQQEVRIARAPSDARPLSVDAACEALKTSLTPLVTRWAITLDGKPLVALPDQKTAGDTLEKAKMKFGSMVQNLAEEPAFRGAVTTQQIAVPISMCSNTADEALAKLFASKTEVSGDGVYVVQNHDLAGSIASSHGMSLEQLRTLNPGVNLDKLSIGDKLRIKAAAGGTESGEAKLKVVVRDLAVKEEAMPAPVQQVPDPQLKIGQTRQISPGKPGQRRVKIATVYENGKNVGTEVASEEILVEPVPQKLAVGTKQN